jgi:tripartite-type tricarboxylate transporter receptor subunit TctC
MTYIPMKGGVPAMQAVLGKMVKAGFNNLSDAYRNIDRLKILAVADSKRNMEFMPEVPTFQELGFQIDDTSVNRRGIFLPKGVPAPIIERCAEGFQKMFKKPEVQQKMKDAGVPMEVLSRDEILAQFKKNDELLKEALKPFIKK